MKIKGLKKAVGDYQRANEDIINIGKPITEIYGTVTMATVKQYISDFLTTA